MATIIVSLTGTANGPGSVESPVRTLQQALDLAKAGDTIMLRSGEYAGGVTVREANITIKNFPGEKAIVSTGSGPDDPEWVIRFGEDAHGGAIDGLEIKGGSYYGVKLESTYDWGGDIPEHGVRNITIQNSILHDSGRDVIKAAPGADGLQILHNEIYNSGMRDGSNAEGIDIVNADDVVIRGNYIHDTATSGAYIKGGAANGLIEGNFIRNTGAGGAQGVDPQDPPNSGAGLMLGYQTDLEWFGKDNPELYQTMNGIVRNNIIQDTADGGIMVWGSKDPQVYNNTLVNVSTRPWYFGGGVMVSGITTWTESGDVYTKTVNPLVMNNIVSVAEAYNGSPGYVTTAAIAILQNGVTGPIRSDNNQVFGQGSQGEKLFDLGDGEITQAQWLARIGADGHSRVAAPQLDANLHLQAGAGAIDGGGALALGADFDGQPLSGGPLDIGADQADNGAPLALPTRGGIGAAPPKGATQPGEGGDGRPGGDGEPGGGAGGGAGDGGALDPTEPDLPFVQLAKAVDGVVGVYSGPDAHAVALDGHLAIKLAATGFSEYTSGLLQIVEQATGKAVGEIDFVGGDKYDGRQVLDIDLTPFNLKTGTTYSVVTTQDFIRVNAEPWQAGAITRGEWQFTTAGDAPTPGPADTPPPTTTPSAATKGLPTDAVFKPLAKAVAGVIGVYSGPDAAHVDTDGHIGLKLVTEAFAEYTSGKLKIVEMGAEVVAGVIDFEKGDAYDGKQVVDIDLTPFHLKFGTTYSVVTTKDFLRVNAAPWQAGPITLGQWVFTTEDAPGAKTAFAAPHIDTPTVVTSIAPSSSLFEGHFG